MTPKICLTILVGLPAAGKTTFCRDFLKNCSYHRFNSVHICYDNFIKFESNVNENVNTSSNYKKQRKDMLTKIETCIKCIQEEKHNEIPIEFIKSSKFSDENSKYIILIDDNNFYRGMRYEFLQLTRKSKISFSQIYFDCTLDFAIRQNSQRAASVTTAENIAIPRDIIIRMYERFEKPSMKNKWERNTFTVKKNHVNTDMVDKCDDKDAQIYEFLNNSLQNAEHYEILEAGTIEKQNFCQSKIHKADLILRKAINTYLKNEVCDVEIARKLNAKRKAVINDFRSGIILLNTEEDINEITQFLEI